MKKKLCIVRDKRGLFQMAADDFGFAGTNYELVSEIKGKLSKGTNSAGHHYTVIETVNNIQYAVYFDWSACLMQDVK